MSTELKRISDFALFAHVVETGSISRCALRLGFERSTVSRRISLLETYLGTRLLERTTKHVTVTDAGRLCYEKCAVILRAAQDAQALAINGALCKPEGPTRIGAPVSLIEAFLSSILDDFKANNPDIDVELELLDIWSDETVADLDVAVAIGPLNLKRTWQKSVASIAQVVCASQSFLSSLSAPVSVDALREYPCIVDEATRHSTAWKLTESGNYIRSPINVQYVVPNLLQARQAAIAGLGIACLPYFMCSSQLQNGELTAILPEYEPLFRELMLLSPKRALPKRNPTALRVSLEEAFKTINLNAQRATTDFRGDA